MLFITGSVLNKLLYLCVVLQYSALIRNNRPGVAAFRLANGYASLRDALSSDSVRFQRYSLVVIT